MHRNSTFSPMQESDTLSDANPNWNDTAMGRVRMSVIDVGKGDCILLQVGALAFLIDTGYEKTSEKVVSYLRSSGVSRLELVVITHYDRDHIGGLRAIGSAFEIGELFLPAYEGADKNYRSLMSAISELGLTPQRVAEARSFELGGARFSLYPSSVTYVPDAKGDEGNDNDLSLASSLVYGDDRFLFTGDLEKDGLAAYLSTAHGQFDVLKVPCHGNKCPYTDELLDDVAPKIAVITDSADDPASNKTLKLLGERGIDAYRTSSAGTVVIEGTGSGTYSVAQH